MKRLKKVANDSYYTAFINSVDTKGSLEIKTVTIGEDTTLPVFLNYHKWGDGAPVLKYFSKEPVQGELELKQGDVFKVVYDNYNKLMYTFRDGVWYQFKESYL